MTQWLYAESDYNGIQLDFDQSVYVSAQTHHRAYIDARGEGSHQVIVAGTQSVIDKNAIYLVIADANAHDKVTVEASGEVRAFGGNAIMMYGNGQQVINRGLVAQSDGSEQAEYCAVYFKSGADSTTISTLDNEGLIEAVGLGVYHHNSAETLELTNSGRIIGAKAFFSNGSSVDKIFNTGTMTGAIQMGAGNDLLDTAGGKIKGEIDLGDGMDTCLGSSAADSVLGSLGNDSINGNGGNETIDGGDGNDTINGGSGSDTLYGYNDDDRIDGGSSDDKILGMAGDDSLIGGAGNDELQGASGDDTMSGGDGKDTLTGGNGFDRMTGGADADQFRFFNKPAANSVDTITDFTHGTDKIALESAYFQELGDKVTSSEFGAKTSGHTAADGQHIIYDKSDGTLWYDADDNGSGAAVQFAKLGTIANHPTNLTYADFIIV